MNPLLPALKGCFQRAATFLRCPPSRLIREFGLNDFATNVVQEEDDAPTLAVKAVMFFCEEAQASDLVFAVTVTAVSLFLNNHYAAAAQAGVPAQAIQDLRGTLIQGLDPQQIRNWVTAHFG
jgi:hypothetical protein